MDTMGWILSSDRDDLQLSQNELAGAVFYFSEIVWEKAGSKAALKIVPWFQGSGWGSQAPCQPLQVMDYKVEIMSFIISTWKNKNK